MKKILVIGNCQAMPLANALSLTTGIEAEHIIAHESLNTPDLELENKLLDSDLVLHFNISDTFPKPVLSTTNIKTLLGEKSRTITNIYFEGIHPDCFYIGKMNARLRGPLGEYHSRIILSCYLNNVPIARAAELFQDAEIYNYFGYFEKWADSESKLVERDKEIDLPFATRFLNVVRKEFSLFSFNHPSANIFMRYANLITSSLKIPDRGVPHHAVPNWLLYGPIFPIFPELSTNLGLDYSCPLIKPANSNIYMNPMELVMAFYKTYDEESTDFLRDQLPSKLLGIDEHV